MVALAVVCAVPAVAIAPHRSSFAFVGVAVFCGLAIVVSVATRSVMVAFPGDRAGQDMGAVWMMSALLIWGPLEALAVALLVGGFWTQFVDNRWGGSHRHAAQQVLNVAATFIGIEFAYLALRAVATQPFTWAHHHAVPQIVGVVVYLAIDACVIFGIVRVARGSGIGEALRSWSTRVMYLTEATLSIGIAAAWNTEPVAGVLLAGTLIAAGAGLHYAHLLEEASTDRRTGLLRPDTWTMTVARLVSRQPVGVILADLDHFKKVNDELGHLAGDEVLALIGSTIAESLRPGDVAGRWGGEEFVVALPGLTPSGAREVAERLADAIRTSPYASAGLRVSCTVSAGVAYAPATSPEDAAAAVRQALREADLAMYAAKRAGRDRVIAFKDLTTHDLDLTAPAGQPQVVDLSEPANSALPDQRRP
jgi:diguanylate cyclase